jgi:hypothetical protein
MDLAYLLWRTFRQRFGVRQAIGRFYSGVRALAAGDLPDPLSFIAIVNLRMALVGAGAPCQIKTDKRPL